MKKKTLENNKVELMAKSKYYQVDFEVVSAPVPLEGFTFFFLVGIFHFGMHQFEHEFKEDLEQSPHQIAGSHLVFPHQCTVCSKIPFPTPLGYYDGMG